MECHLYNRQAEATSMSMSIGSSEKALRDALLVLLRDTWSLVQDLNDKLTLVGYDAAPDVPVFG